MVAVWGCPKGWYVRFLREMISRAGEAVRGDKLHSHKKRLLYHMGIFTYGGSGGREDGEHIAQLRLNIFPEWLVVLLDTKYLYLIFFKGIGQPHNPVKANAQPSFWKIRPLDYNEGTAMLCGSNPVRRVTIFLPQSTTWTILAQERRHFTNKKGALFFSFRPSSIQAMMLFKKCIQLVWLPCYFKDEEPGPPLYNGLSLLWSCSLFRIWVFPNFSF